jgi:hypothetical protein
MPIPVPGRSNPPPGLSPASPAIPPPVGIGLSQRPPALDPNNPLAAVVGGSFRASAPPPAAPRAEPQRIEVDEQAVQHARSGVRKQMLVLMLVAAAIAAGIGVAAGNASAKGAGRTQAQGHAKMLQSDVLKAKDSLTQLADKLDGGMKTLKDKKYPDTLAQDLAKINVDFDGGKLGGKRFDGMGIETTAQLVDFVTRVQSINDKKKFVQGLLTKLQKAITEELKAAETGTVTYSWVAVVDRDRWGEGVYIGALQPPFVPSKDKPNLPDKLTFLNPRSGQGNVEMPHYMGGDVKEKAPVAMHINPASWERACPSAEKGQIAQLARQLASLKDEVRHDKGLGQQSDNVIDEPKPDMIELSQNLADALGKAAQ